MAAINEVVWVAPEWGYKIERMRPTMLRAFEYQGILFHVHRPVIQGRRVITDWQFSKDGFPLETLGGKTVEEATDFFIEKAEMVGFQFDKDDRAFMSAL